MAGRNGVEGQTGWQEKRIIRGLRKISRGTAPVAIFGTTGKRTAHRRDVIIFSRKRSRMKASGIAAAVRMAGIPHVLGIACRKSFGRCAGEGSCK